MFRLKPLFFFSIATYSLLPLFLLAQPGKTSLKKDSIAYKDSVSQVDVLDVLHFILHKKQKKTNFEEERVVGKLYNSILPAFGYSLITGLAVDLTGNIAFYTGILPQQKISSIQYSLVYTQYHQFLLPIQANIWSRDNRYNYIFDWRFLKFPSYTYGLGGTTTAGDGYIVDYYSFKIHQSVFRSISKNLYAGVGYYFDHLWGIKELNPIPGIRTSFEKYGFARTETASGPVFRILHDSRLNQINPHNGFYSNIVFRPNFTFMGSQNNWQSLLLEFRKYFKLPSSSNNIIAFWSYNWLTTSGRVPYLLLPSTGWDDPFNNTGRGYIQGRFRGKNMIYLEAEYRFGIMRNGLLGGVVFANAQYFSKDHLQPIRIIEPAIGTGLRIKINKISGTNICLDYGIGLNGSRGIFVNLTEVF